MAGDGPFPNDTVAIVSGLLVGSGIAGLFLMVFGAILYRKVRQEIEEEESSMVQLVNPDISAGAGALRDFGGDDINNHNNNIGDANAVEVKKAAAEEPPRATEEEEDAVAEPEEQQEQKPLDFDGLKSNNKLAEDEKNEEAAPGPPVVHSPLRPPVEDREVQQQQEAFEFQGRKESTSNLPSAVREEPSGEQKSDPPVVAQEQSGSPAAAAEGRDKKVWKL